MPPNRKRKRELVSSVVPVVPPKPISFQTEEQRRQNALVSWRVMNEYMSHPCNIKQLEEFYGRYLAYVEGGDIRAAERIQEEWRSWFKTPDLTPDLFRIIMAYADPGVDEIGRQYGGSILSVLMRVYAFVEYARMPDLETPDLFMFQTQEQFDAAVASAEKLAKSTAAGPDGLIINFSLGPAICTGCAVPLRVDAEQRYMKLLERYLKRLHMTVCRKDRSHRLVQELCDEKAGQSDPLKMLYSSEYTRGYTHSDLIYFTGERADPEYKYRIHTPFFYRGQTGRTENEPRLAFGTSALFTQSVVETALAVPGIVEEAVRASNAFPDTVARMAARESVWYKLGIIGSAAAHYDFPF
jgi:hypothetical protein